MASLPVTAAWSDPSSSLTTGKTYVVQNKSGASVQFYEGSTFNATTNDADGVMLVPLHSMASGPNHMRWTFDSANAVRMRMLVEPFGGGNVVEFFPAV